MNEQRVPFTNTATVIIGNYQLQYVNLFGNNPLIAIYVQQGTAYNQDVQTAPSINYTTSGDPTSGIASITWTFGEPQSGFIQIYGKGTNL